MKIDKNVPIPFAPRIAPKYPWKDMEIGDSFFVENKSIGLTTSGRKWAQDNKKDWKFSGRTVEENGKKGVRIWRIK